MKLGLSQASYRWVCYPWLRYDRPEYRLSERRLPYFTSVDPPEAGGDPPVAWTLERVAAHDLASIYMEVGWLGNEAGAAKFRDRLEERGLVFLAGSEANLAATPEEWGEPEYPPQGRPAWPPIFEITSTWRSRASTTSSCSSLLERRLMSSGPSIRSNSATNVLLTRYPMDVELAPGSKI